MNKIKRVGVTALSLHAKRIDGTSRSGKTDAVTNQIISEGGARSGHTFNRSSPYSPVNPPWLENYKRNRKNKPPKKAR